MNKNYIQVIYLKTVYLYESKKLTKRRIRKIAKKLDKINQKEQIVLAISNSLSENIELREEIESYNIEILDR